MTTVSTLRRLGIAAAAALAMAFGTIHPATAEEVSVDPADEQYRPALHFTPERNWMNDPNGLVYDDGTWHLFF